MIDLGGRQQASAAYGVLKPSIILFDCQPGTRSVTLPPGKYRVAVVGAGAGGSRPVPGSGGGYAEKEIIVSAETTYSYTVGAGGISGSDLVTTTSGETTSFAALLSATGGEKPSSLTLPSIGGIGVSGDINTKGGGGALNAGGGSAGHRFGDGQSSEDTGSSYVTVGAGFSGSGISHLLSSHVDGWGLGIPPGFDGYGRGAMYIKRGSSSTQEIAAGMGGGGCEGPLSGDGGVGAGAGEGAGNMAGNGLLIVEKLA